jgi:hypothetical protein
VIPVPSPRWRIAELLNRLPSQCWANLVSWALSDRGYDPWQPIDATCRKDAACTGACYCGKLHQAGQGPCRPKLHCHSHNRDEAGPAYIACGECGHLYRSARSLRRAYRRVHGQILRHGWRKAPWLPHRSAPPFIDSRVERIWIWLRSRFVRASSITFCQECTHDF